MIQRIQTLYLLTVVILSVITFFSPVASFFNSSNALEYIINYKGVMQIQENASIFKGDTWTLTVLSAIIPIVTLISIFLFKNRILQLRLTFFNMVLMAGWYALLFINIWFTKSLYQADWTIEFVAAFPLINIILSLLAVRAIGRDEALIKSLNRLR
jgi:flagellar biosynthesis protein FlhB